MKYVFLCLIFLSGCGEKIDETSNKEIEDKLKNISSEIESIRTEVYFLKQFKKNSQDYRSINLNVADKSFSIIDAGLCKLSVAIYNISKYSTGSRVEFLIGNPCTNNFSNIGFLVEYGPDDNSDNWQSKKINEPIVLYPANWNSVNVILEKLPPEKISKIRISEFEIGSVNFKK